MAITVSCDCGKTYRVGDDKAGKKIKCKDCGTVLAVPSDDEDAVEVEEEEWERPAARRPAPRGASPRAGSRASRPAPKKSSSGGGVPASVFIAIAIVLFLMVGGTGAYYLIKRVGGGGAINELTYIPNDAGIYLLVRPSKIFSSPLVSGLPQDVLNEPLKKLEDQGLGQLDPRKIEFIAVAGSPPAGRGANPGMAGQMPGGMPGGMPGAMPAGPGAMPAMPAGPMPPGAAAIPGPGAIAPPGGINPAGAVPPAGAAVPPGGVAVPPPAGAGALPGGVAVPPPAGAVPPAGATIAPPAVPPATPRPMNMAFQAPAGLAPPTAPPAAGAPGAIPPAAAAPGAVPPGAALPGAAVPPGAIPPAAGAPGLPGMPPGVGPMPGGAAAMPPGASPAMPMPGAGMAGAGMAGAGMAGPAMASPGGAPGSSGAEGGTIVVRMIDATDFESLITNAKPVEGVQRKQYDHKGKKYWQIEKGGMGAAPSAAGGQNNPNDFIMTPVDDRTLLMGSKSMVLAMLDARPKAGAMTAKVKSQQLDRDFVLVMFPASLQAVANASSMLAPPMMRGAPTAELNQMKSFVAAIDLSGSEMLSIKVDGNDATAGASLENSFKEAQKKLDDLYNMMKQFQNPNASQAEKDVMTFAEKLKAGISITRSGNETTLTLKNPGGWEPIVAAMKKSIEESRAAAQRMVVINNMKQIGLALHNFHDTFGSFPPKEDGSGSGLSWRVHLLPYLGEAPLYQQFKLDEPWDSPTNRPLVERMPKVFESAQPGEKGKTRFLGFAGEGTVFGPRKGLKLRDLTDGSSSTLLAVEVAPEKAVIWTKPEDAAFNPADPKLGMGRLGEKFVALFADGSVKSLKSSIDNEKLKGLITFAGGEMIDIFFLE